MRSRTRGTSRWRVLAIRTSRRRFGVIRTSIVHRLLRAMLRMERMREAERFGVMIRSRGLRRQQRIPFGNDSKKGDSNSKLRSPIAAQELSDIAVESSQAERRAADAERELMEWKKMRFMADKVGDDFKAIILSVTKYGFFVELDELFIEGMVPIASLAGRLLQLPGYGPDDLRGADGALLPGGRAGRGDPGPDRPAAEAVAVCASSGDGAGGFGYVAEGSARGEAAEAEVEETARTIGHPPRHFLRKVFMILGLGLDLNCKVLIPGVLSVKSLDRTVCRRVRKLPQKQKAAWCAAFVCNPLLLL